MNMNIHPVDISSSSPAVLVGFSTVHLSVIVFLSLCSFCVFASAFVFFCIKRFTYFVTLAKNVLFPFRLSGGAGCRRRENWGPAVKPSRDLRVAAAERRLQCPGSTHHVQSSWLQEEVGQNDAQSVERACDGRCGAVD